MINANSSSVFSTMRKLYGIFTPGQKRSFAWLTFFTFLSSFGDLLGLSMLIPAIGLVLSDDFYHTFTNALPFLARVEKQQLLLWTLLLFFVLVILKNLFTLYVNKLQVDFVQDVFSNSSINVLKNIFSKSLIEIQNANSNSLVNKLTYYQSSLGSNLAIPAIIILNELMIFGLTAILVCVWNWKLLLLLFIVLAPTVGLFYYKVRQTLAEAGRKKSQRMVKLNIHAQTMIFGYTDIKIAGTEKRFYERYLQFIDEFGAYQRRRDLLGMIPAKIIEIAIFLCAILILLYGIFVLNDVGKIITTISLFSVIAYRITPSIQRIIMASNNINATSFILNDPDILINHQRPLNVSEDLLTFNERIRFDNISYKYPGSNTYVLENCNLEIKKGEKIGIIGRSGSGKSTLIKNILGYYQPTSGKLLIDDQSLNENNLEGWWNLLGYVRQDVFIMNATIIENIAIGIPIEEVHMQQLEKAISFASLSDYVAGMPEGVYTVLAENGNNLSGGQKQRIAIARAIYKGASILIFDEATSSLDSETEQQITDAIQRLRKENLTTVIIAHRLTSLKYCDKIYELRDGQFTASYSYGELLEKAS